MLMNVWLHVAIVLAISGYSLAFSKMDFTINVTEHLTLGWRFAGDSIFMTLEKNRPGYASIGFGTSMAEGDCFLVETINRTLTVNDAHMIGKKSPSKNETQDWVIINSTLNDSGFKVEMKRKLDTSEPLFDVVLAPKEMDVMYAYSNSPSVGYHGGIDSAFSIIKVNFEAGGAKEAPYWRFGNGSFMKHEHTQFLLWTIGADILIPVGRYLRKYSRFFDGHSWPMLAILIFSVLMRAPHRESANKVKESHGYFAWVILILSGLIAFNGLFLRLIIEFSPVRKAADLITNVRRLHGILGVATWVVARYMVFLGTTLHKKSYGPLMQTILFAETGVFLLAIFFLEVFRFREYNFKRREIPETKNLVSQQSNAFGRKGYAILRDMRAGMTIDELKAKYPGRHVFIYNNRVFDLSGYVHPGGQSIYNATMWREVSRFLHGSVGVETYDGRTWMHSRQAFEKLEECCLGDLITPETDIVIRNQDSHPYVTSLRDEWFLIARKKISDHTALLQFKCSNVRVKLTCKGTQWLGRHYTISDGFKSRAYTNCTTLAEEYAHYRRDLLAYFEEHIQAKGGKPKKPFLPEFIEYLPFCIKQYEGPTALSKKLVSEDQDLFYTVEGPIGRGLEIPEDFKGHVLIIVGGNGILPFVDLLDFLLKKAIYMVCKKQGIDTSFIQPEQEYSRFFPGARFMLLGAFRTAEDVLGIDILRSLIILNERHNLDMFDCLLRVGDLKDDKVIKTTESRFSATLLRQFTKLHSQEVVMICGPPAMQSALYNDLTSDLKLKPDSIVFV